MTKRCSTLFRPYIMCAICGGGHGTNLSQLVSSHPQLIIFPTISIAAEREPQGGNEGVPR